MRYVPTVSCFDGPQAVFPPFFRNWIFHAFFCPRKFIPFVNILPSFICTYHERTNCFNACSWLQFKVLKFKNLRRPVMRLSTAQTIQCPSRSYHNSQNWSPNLIHEPVSDMTRCCTKKESLTNQTLFYPAQQSERNRVGAVSGTAGREKNQERGERATIGHGFGGHYLILV